MITVTSTLGNQAMLLSQQLLITAIRIKLMKAFHTMGTTRNHTHLIFFQW